MQLLGGGRELFRERRNLVGFALDRRDRRADFLEHAIEALLEKAELVGFGGGGAHGEVTLLRFPHDTARAPDALNQRRRNPLQRHRDADEHPGFEVCDGVEPRPTGIQTAVRPAREQIGNRCDQYQEVADRLPLIEGIGQDGEEQRRDYAAVSEPDDDHIDERHVEQREHIDEPPAVPAALVDHPDDGVDDRAGAGDEDDRAEARLDHRRQIPQRAEQEQRRGDRPAAAVAALERLEILEALLEGSGFVVPAADPGGERGAACGVGHFPNPNPRSDAVRNASTR